MSLQYNITPDLAGWHDRFLADDAFDWYWSDDNLGTYVPWEASDRLRDLANGAQSDVYPNGITNGMDGGASALVFDGSVGTPTLHMPLNNNRFSELKFPFSCLFVGRAPVADGVSQYILQSSDFFSTGTRQAGFLLQTRPGTGMRIAIGNDTNGSGSGRRIHAFDFLDMYDDANPHLFSLTWHSVEDCDGYGDGRVLTLNGAESSGTATTLAHRTNYDGALAGSFANDDATAFDGAINVVSLHNAAWTPDQHMQLHEALMRNPQGGPFAMRLDIPVAIFPKLVDIDLPLGEGSGEGLGGTAQIGVSRQGGIGDGAGEGLGGSLFSGLSLFGDVGDGAGEGLGGTAQIGVLRQGGIGDGAGEGLGGSLFSGLSVFGDVGDGAGTGFPGSIKTKSLPPAPGRDFPGSGGGRRFPGHTSGRRFH